jgi:hypothetical protein
MVMQWIDVVNHLRARYRIGQVTDRWIELWWRFRDGKLAIRQQQVVWAAELGGVPYFVVASEVGVPRRLRAAVCRQPRVGIGTLVEDDDRLELRITLPAQGLMPETLDRVLYAIASEAVQLSVLSQEQPLLPAPAAAP